MKALDRMMLLIGLLMFAGAGLAYVMTPTKKIASESDKVNLEKMIPESFGDWKIDTSIVPVLPSPELLATLEKIYNQTLARTYINSKGRHIMLSIAYSDDQYEGLNTHRPEICYPAQGFDILKGAVGQLVTRYGKLPVTRLLAQQRARNEPITYWVIVGDKVTFFGLPHKLAQLRYGLTGTVADGMLVRVSSIDRDENGAYQLQQEFLDAMLAGMSDKDRARIAGRFGI
jgi:EpsI family protein